MVAKLCNRCLRALPDICKCYNCLDQDIRRQHNSNFDPHMRLKIIDIQRNRKFTWTINIIDDFGVEKSHSLSSHCSNIFELFWHYRKVRNFDSMSDCVIVPIKVTLVCSLS